MSNIYTTSVRIYASTHRISDVEAEWITWMLLGPRGSYCVPVSIRLDPVGRFVDIQYGSGKSGAIADFCDQYVGPSDYRTIWGRTLDEGSDEDVLWHHHYRDGPARFCRYGFDEVRIQYEGAEPPVAADQPWRREAGDLWRLPVAGSYRTGNGRSLGDADQTPSSTPPVPPQAKMPLDTPTTPNVDGRGLKGIDPPWLASFTDECPGIRRIEYFWRGRTVHLTTETDGSIPASKWWNRCADDWDNCLDAEFLRDTGAEHLLLAPEL